MILWTIQPLGIYEMIQETGVYRCDSDAVLFQGFIKQYDWLSSQMIRRIGKAPKGIKYPVWAWYQWEGIRKRPDLRRERWINGWKGDRFACMEIEIPDNEVLLSDFDEWCGILNDALLSETEEEDTLLEQKYLSLSDADKWEMKSKNWEGVFNLSPLDSEWITRGDSIQATFWELRKDQIKEVRIFTAAKPKPPHLTGENE